MSEPSAATIVEYLNQALVDLRETEDYLSYATLIDVHMSDESRFTIDEKVQLISELNKILTENPDITYEIGWDLPELVLNYLDAGWDIEALRKSPIVVLSMNTFELLAKNGNPKENFIKVIELLSSFKYPSKDDENFSKKDRMVDVKIHILFELLSSSLKRINTIYPSKFLGMALGAILKFVSNYTNYATNIRILLRRTYTFIRDYIPPLKPINYIEENNLTKEEASKIEEDENYLQSVLLQSFITHLYSICFTRYSLSLSFKHYHNLQLTKKGFLPIDYTSEIEDPSTSNYTIFLRLLTLASSFDIDIEFEFEKLQSDSIELFSKIDDEKSDDDKIQDLLKFSINDLISNLYHPESKTIPKSSIGLLILSSQFCFEDKLLEIKTHELILLTIRFLSPGLISQKFRSFGCLDSLLYLNWLNIMNNEKLNDYKKVPKYQINLFLQIIIFYSSVTNDPSIGLISYTLLTKILTLIDEENSYEFLIDTLTTAPYQNAKMAIISILKDLILRVKNDEVEELTEDLEKISLNSKPTVPKRSYISLSNSRMNDIYSLIRESIDETFENGFNENSSKLTLGYLNLLIGLRKIFSKNLQLEIINVLNDYLEENNENDDNILQLIKLANDSLISLNK